ERTVRQSGGKHKGGIFKRPALPLAMSDGKCLAGESARVPHGPKAGFGHGWRKRAGTSQEFVPAPLRAALVRSSPPSMPASSRRRVVAQSSLRSRLRRLTEFPLIRRT